MTWGGELRSKLACQFLFVAVGGNNHDLLTVFSRFKACIGKTRDDAIRAILNCGRRMEILMLKDGLDCSFKSVQLAV